MHPLQFAPNDRDINEERKTNCREMKNFVVLVFIFEQMTDVVVDKSNTVNSNMNIVYNVNNQSSQISNVPMWYTFWPVDYIITRVFSLSFNELFDFALISFLHYDIWN